jgi:hypothetical protein
MAVLVAVPIIAAARGFLQFEVAAEDDADGFGFGFVDHQLLVPGLVAGWDRAAGPIALAPGGGDLVPDPFELSEGQEHVQGQSAHQRCGIELLGNSRFLLTAGGGGSPKKSRLAGSEFAIRQHAGQGSHSRNVSDYSSPVAPSFNSFSD